jgi:cystathionine beta-lyase/cystathionine gamma-synthase
MDGGKGAYAFASGLAAIDAVTRLFAPGDRLVVTEDLYGGTFRHLEKLVRPYGIETVYVNTANSDAVEEAFAKNRVQGVFLEVPSNPLLNIADIRAIRKIATTHGAILIVDNTFLTPCRMRPIELGADLVVYSGTKYLGGHDDVVAGVVVAATEKLAGRIGFLQNAAGAILGPQDSWLLLRGLKTLPLRMAKQEANAARITERLAAHPRVRRVYYPGLAKHPGHDVLQRQASGFGAMISFEVENVSKIAEILSGVQVFMFAESLGGVESLITYPAVQTHADIDPVTRERIGVTDRLLRISVGIEDIADLIHDLERVL